MRRVALCGVVVFVTVGLAGAANDGASRRLVAAVARGDATQVAALVREGADPDAADRSGWTGLHLAAERSDLTLARVLLGAGARPDLRSRARGTPLDIAERGGHTEMARLLRLHGAKGSATRCACGPGAGTATARSSRAPTPPATGSACRG
jgi:ankyrin repeat protein